MPVALALVLVLAGTIAYAPGLDGAFVLDDEYTILENPHIRDVRPLWKAVVPPEQSVQEMRWRGPVVALTLAWNHRMGALEPRGYHVFNVAIHLATALVLFGLARRSLAGPLLRERSASEAAGLAFACALLWVVHPLTTDAVTYVSQRTESLMGLFYLLTLYGLVRGAGGERAWYVVAVTACAAGMLTKEVMATAPVVALLHDRTFLTGSFSESWRRRRVVFILLAATWGLLAWLMLTSPHGITGFVLGVGPLDYLLAQCGVVFHYLQQVVWPTGLILDYGVTRSVPPTDAAVPGIVLLALLGGTAVALHRRPAVGFLGAWFFLILAPTSSFIPIVTEVGAERRMYVPLMAVVVLGVIGGFTLLRRWRPAIAGRAGLAIAVALAMLLTALTRERNALYTDPVSLWRDTIAKLPENPRAHANLGRIFLQRGELNEAGEHYARAVDLGAASYSLARFNLATIRQRQGRAAEAAALYRETLETFPQHVPALSNLAWILATSPDDELRNGQEALTFAQQAIRLTDAKDVGALRAFGAALAETGLFDEAVRATQVLVTRPEDVARIRAYREGRPWRDPSLDRRRR